MTLKLFVDCSKTYLYSANLNTGVQGVAGNSINSGTIETYQNLVLNKYIREDFKKGKLSFGAAIMQARYVYTLNKDLMENRFYYKFKRFVKLIIKRLLF